MKTSLTEVDKLPTLELPNVTALASLSESSREAASDSFKSVAYSCVAVVRCLVLEAADRE